MAITLQQQPVPLQPAFNEAIFIVSSNNVALSNFKFVCDVYVGGVKVDRLIVPPHPTHLTGLFNIAKVLESRVTQDIAISDDRVMANDASNVSYVLKFGESYSTGSTGSTIYENLTVTGTKYLWNGILDFEDYCSYASGDYIVSSPTSRFLTNKPSSGTIYPDDYGWIYWNDFNLVVNEVRVITYLSSGLVSQTFKISNATPTKRFNRIPAGFVNINAIPVGQFTTGTPPMFSSGDGIAQYSIQLFNLAGTAISEKYFYNIGENCSRYEKRNIIFMNKLGGYDFFDFTLVSKESIDIERSNYKKNLGSYASANSFVFSTNNRANTQFNTKIKDRVILKSDWVTEAQMEWLEELLTSPAVHVIKGGALVPINITNSSFEKKKEVNEKLFSLEIEINYSYDRYRQRR